MSKKKTAEKKERERKRTFLLLSLSFFSARLSAIFSDERVKWWVLVLCAFGQLRVIGSFVGVFVCVYVWYVMLF